MSYSVTVKTVGGVPVVASYGGTVPDGTVNISGNADDSHVRIGVTSIDTAGMPVVQATGFSHPYAFVVKPEPEETKL